MQAGRVVVSVAVGGGTVGVYGLHELGAYDGARAALLGLDGRRGTAEIHARSLQIVLCFPCFQQKFFASKRNEAKLDPFLFLSEYSEYSKKQKLFLISHIAFGYAYK